MKINQITAFITMSLLAPIHLIATSIAPFSDLGEVSYISSHIAMAEALPVDTFYKGDVTYYRQRFQIIDALKGDCLDYIEVEKLSRQVGDGFMAVAGDINYQAGNKYLLFLRERGTYDFYPTCSSYYIYQIENYKKSSLAIPIYEDGSMRIKNQSIYESAHEVFDYKKLKQLITDHLSKKQRWNQSEAEVKMNKERNNIALKMSPPTGCNYLPSSPIKTRWQFSETQAIPLYYQGYTGGCSNLTSELSNTANYINTNYTGLSVTPPTASSGYNYGGCNTGNPIDALGNFLSSRFGDRRRIYIMFNDPCNQIPALFNCRGTLGYGGSYWGSTHTYNGTTYLTSSTGFVVVNEGVERCYCGNSESGDFTNFTSFMTHELTHALGMGHISDANALMNPFCCNEINNSDLRCMDFLYPNGGPACTHTNRTFSNTTISSSTTRADNNINVSNTVRISNNATVIWSAENQISFNGVFTVPAGALLEIGAEDCQ